MRCAVIAAVLLLVYIQDAAAASQAEVSSMCQSTYPPNDCGGGWYRIDPTRCAKYFKEKKEFWKAERHCWNLGSDLVSIHSDDENNNVLCLALRTTNNGNLFWIGGTVSIPHMFYIRWTDRTDMNFNRWYTGQPDNHWEGCVEMNYGDWGYWNNERCVSTRYFVCAKNM